MAIPNSIAAAVVAVVAGSITPYVVRADSHTKGTGFISFKASEIKWSDAPSIGPGAKIAVLEGDAKTAAPFTMRLKLPSNSRIDVHTHPAVERVTILSGTFYFSTGDKYDTAKAQTYASGDGFIVPVGMPMYGLTKNGETIIQIHGMGPWGITYLSPKKDPPKGK